MFTINASKKELDELTLTNTFGQNLNHLISISEATEKSIKIDLSHLAKGQYIIRTSTSSKVISVGI